MEEALIGVAKSSGPSLASFAQEQLLLLCCSDTQLQKLDRTMETITDYLEYVDDEERKGRSSLSDKRWVSDLRDAMYDVDDVHDEMLTMAGRKRLMEGNWFLIEVKLFFSSSNHLITSYSLAQRVKTIRENLDDIAKNRRDFSGGSQRHREEGMPVESRNLCDNVVGREIEKDKIISMLLDLNSNDNVCVIPIVGVGGLGKSTLARYVFNDDMVKANFKDLRLWVPLVQDITLEGVIRKIVEVGTQTKSEPRTNSDLESLNVCLSGLIDGKKYIIVLDNVWNESAADWHDLESLLTLGAAKGSRILLTTRSPAIARIMGTVNPFELQPLGEDHSWSLLESIVFRNKGCHDPKLKEIGLETLAMCYNVPLAVRALASVLATNISVSFWSTFLNDSVSRLRLRDKRHDIMPILKSSYDYLSPSSLRSCFSYCSLFPKGHVFDKNKLVLYWIAQGFIAPLHGTNLSLEDRGEMYLDMLLNKGLLQDVHNDDSDSIIFRNDSCKLHDLMYELSCSVSAGQCKILISNEDVSIGRNIRHLSVYHKGDRSFEIPPLLSVQKLRTLVLEKLYSDAGCMSTFVFDSLMKSGVSLRILDLSSLGIKEVPKSLGKLIHLRYLDLSWNEFKRLPSSITLLYNLQYLNLKGTKLTELPKDMKKLVNLSHLLLAPLRLSLSYFPSGLGKLSNLQTLNLFVAGSTEIEQFETASRAHIGAYTNRSDCGQLSDLKSLNLLRGELRICIRSYKSMGSDAMEANLKGKKNIKSLILDWGTIGLRNDEDELVLENLQPSNQISELSIRYFKGNKMPTWMATNRILSCLENLTSVEIYDCENITQVPSFSRLPYLKSLKLSRLEAVRYMESGVDEHETDSLSPGSSSSSSSSSTVFFPSLTVIKFFWLPNLRGWREHESEGSSLSFPCASDVTISNCKSLISLPSWPNVKKLSLKGVPNLRIMSTWSDVSVMESLEIDSVDLLASIPVKHLGEVSELMLYRDPYLSNYPAEGNILGKGLESMKCVKSLVLEGDFFDGYCGLPLQLSATVERLELMTYEDDVLLGHGDESLKAWQALKRLRSLRILRNKSMDFLPRGIGYLTELQSLQLYFCDNLTEMPSWIGNLSSLSRLQIGYCPKIMSFPQEMTKLTQLQHLAVLKCPQLRPRLEKNVGVDWVKIQHIKEIIISHSWIECDFW